MGIVRYPFRLPRDRAEAIRREFEGREIKMDLEEPPVFTARVAEQHGPRLQAAIDLLDPSLVGKLIDELIDDLLFGG